MQVILNIFSVFSQYVILSMISISRAIFNRCPRVCREHNTQTARLGTGSVPVAGCVPGWSVFLLHAKYFKTRLRAGGAELKLYV